MASAASQWRSTLRRSGRCGPSLTSALCPATCASARPLRQKVKSWATASLSVATRATATRHPSTPRPSGTSPGDVASVSLAVNWRLCPVGRDSGADRTGDDPGPTSPVEPIEVVSTFMTRGWSGRVRQVRCRTQGKATGVGGGRRRGQAHTIRRSSSHVLAGALGASQRSAIATARRPSPISSWALTRAASTRSRT